MAETTTAIVRPVVEGALTIDHGGCSSVPRFRHEGGEMLAPG